MTYFVCCQKNIVIIIAYNNEVVDASGIGYERRRITMDGSRRAEKEIVKKEELDTFRGRWIKSPLDLWQGHRGWVCYVVGVAAEIGRRAGPIWIVRGRSCGACGNRRDCVSAGGTSFGLGIVFVLHDMAS